MSTVAEVIAARHMGMKVLAISCVTNMAAGILDQPLSHAEVMETGERVKTTFESLLRAVLPRMRKKSTNCHAERSTAFAKRSRSRSKIEGFWLPARVAIDFGGACRLLTSLA